MINNPGISRKPGAQFVCGPKIGDLAIGHIKNLMLKNAI